MPDKSAHTPYAPPTATVADPLDPRPVRIGRYVWIFTGALVAAFLVVLTLTLLTTYQPGGFIGLLEMIFAAAVTGALFVQNNKRIPTPAERSKLIWWSFAASLLVVLIPLGGFLVYAAFIYGLADVRQGISE